MSKRVYDRESDDPITVEVVRDGRLRTRIHWEWNGNHVLIRAPRRTSKRQLDSHVADIVQEVKQKRARVRSRADKELEAMARELNRECFGSEVEWHSIRWVTNMKKRLGSCTVRGPTGGDIRVSDKIKGWPNWVVQYVVAHEMAHLKYANHSKEFWTYVYHYPKAERARGFIQGFAFQVGEDAEEWL